jgi:subtilisin family serine protease/outer membrane protein OmpA-like peptidoglycan-associated protein
MDATTPKSRFAEFNLDPALAEAVESASGQEIIEGILRLDDPRQIPPKFTLVSQFIRICTGRFLASDAWTIRLHPNVLSLKAARPMGIYECCKHPPQAGDSEEIIQRTARPLPFTGRGCIVAALDFGLDFTHPNFLNSDGTTRVTTFWNQVAPYDPAHPNRYGYGRVFSPDEINRALRASDPYQALGYHPAISDTGHGSHGTHTLDIAAGNGRAPGSTPGVAPDADLLFVHLSTPSPGPTGDLGDSVRMLEALDFVHRTAQDRPWVVNLSVGRTAGSHDGTSPFEQGMHEILRLGSGRAIVQSAGNYRAADLAVEGWLRDGESRDLEWIIDPRDTTPNEIDAWYSGNDRFLVALQPSEGGRFVEVRLGEVADISHNGGLVGRIYHRKNDPNNRDNHIEVFLYPNAAPGVWTLRLIGEYVINGRFHAWIERSLARPGAQSRFDRKITTQSYTLGTIATSPLVITVGAYDAHADGEPLAPFSSCGPTRDDRHEKPELLAPGVSVLAARSIPRGAARQEGLLVARSGTSMATPHVAGCVATMFEAAGRPVSIQEIRNCLKQSAEPVTDGENTDCCAWGRLNIAEAIKRIRDLTWPDSIPTAQTESFASDHSRTTAWPAISDAITEEFTPFSKNERVQIPSDRRRTVEFDPDLFLERAEQAISKSSSGRRQSEMDFLQQLLRELDGRIFAPGLSPAALFRAVVKDSSATFGSEDFFTIVALPSAQPEATLRRCDWMLRAAPGTGDVGHISVLASDDLLPHSALAPNGIAAEGQQPGYYGLVVEAGAFSHTRSCQFARRFLDSRGRVPPHTSILRPKYSWASVLVDVPLTEPDVHPEFAEDAPATAQQPSPRAQPQSAMESQAPPAPGPLELDPSVYDADNDVVLVIITIVKPGDVGQYWADKVRPNHAHWAHPLSELENGYIELMTDSNVPEFLRMRTPIDPKGMTSEDSDAARSLFGNGADAGIRYANYENRRRILANYVYTHPATVRLELGLYRMVREINPLHFALERGWQIGSGKEMFTEQEVSRLGSAFEFVASVALVYGIGQVLQASRPASGAVLTAPRSLSDPIYDLPAEGGGMRINNRWYTEHALERMAPDTPQVREQLRARVGTRLERIGITSKFPAYDRILARALKKINPRGVSPSEVESEILKPGSTNVRVVTARRGGVVVTVIPRRIPSPNAGPTESDPGEDYTPQQLEACKRDWLKFLDTFPSDVRESLNSQGPDSAVVVAIHHGIRDLKRLAKLSFYAKYGQERGYCPIEPRDAFYKIAQSSERMIVQNFLARPAPPRVQRGGVTCQKVERVWASPLPDAPAVNITGRYEHRYPDPADPRWLIANFTFNINQAGRHIEGHITDVLRPQDPADDRYSTRFHGDLQPDGSFLVYSIAIPDKFWGYFTYEQKGQARQLYWQPMASDENKPDGPKLGLTKVSDAPTLMESAFSEHAFRKDGPVFFHERWPLTQAQIKHLVTSLAEDKIAPLLQRYFTMPADDRVPENIKLRAAAQPLNDYLQSVFTHRYLGIHVFDLEFGRYYANNILSQGKWTFKQITRSVLDWIQIMLDVQSGFGFHLKQVTDYLGLKPTVTQGQQPVDPTVKPHKYKVSFSLHGLLVYYRGTITVEKTTGSRWKQSFKIALKGFQVKPGFSVSEEGEAETYYDWTERDIPGSVETVFAKVGGSAPGVKLGAGAWFMHIFGSNYLPYMTVLGTDLSANLKLDDKFKLDVINLGGLWGEIYSKDLPDKDYSKFVSTTNYVADYKLQDDVHFCLGSSLLTEDARQALRIVCAHELAGFMSPDSTLKIVGHTDRVDTEARNYELSEMRAKNSLVVIRDVLGSSFQIPDDPAHLIHEGKGEEEAAKAQPNGQNPDPRFRRVDIFLNSRLVFSLKAK